MVDVHMDNYAVDKKPTHAEAGRTDAVYAATAFAAVRSRCWCDGQ